jgi:hypothetical protein
MDHSRAMIKEHSLNAGSLPCCHTLPVWKPYFQTFEKMGGLTRRKALRLPMGDMYIEVSQVVLLIHCLELFGIPFPFIR